MARLILLAVVVFSMPSYAAWPSWLCSFGDLVKINKTLLKKLTASRSSLDLGADKHLPETEKFSPQDFSDLLTASNFGLPDKKRVVSQGDWWADSYSYRLPLDRVGVTVDLEWVQLAGPRYPGDPGNPIKVTFFTGSNNDREFGHWVNHALDGHPDWKLRGRNSAYELSVPADSASAKKLSQLFKELTDPRFRLTAGDLAAGERGTVESAPLVEGITNQVTEPIAIRGGKLFPLFGVLPSSIHRLVTDHPETIPVAPALAPFGEFIFKSSPYAHVDTTSNSLGGLQLEIDPAKITYDRKETSYEAIDNQRHGLIKKSVVTYFPKGAFNDGDPSYYVSVSIPRGLRSDARNIEQELKRLVVEAGLNDQVTVRPTRLVGKFPRKLLDKIGLEINVRHIPNDALKTPLLMSKIRAWLKEQEME